MAGRFCGVTSDLKNLSRNSEYDGTDEVRLGDGSGLPVSHVGTMTFYSSSRPFHLHETLCVPEIQQKRIYVHQFTKTNHVFIEFHPAYFLDQNTGATLLRGPCEDGVYALPSNLRTNSSSVAFSHERISLQGWHKRLEHPSMKILSHVVHRFSLPLLANKTRMSSTCTSCRVNKAHQLPFRDTSLTSNSPLELIFSDVWGPSSVPSVDGYKYYVIFVDLFKNIYIWLSPLHQKSDVCVVFPQFQKRNQFDAKIKTLSLYSDNGGELPLKIIFFLMA